MRYSIETTTDSLQRVPDKNVIAHLQKVNTMTQKSYEQFGKENKKSKDPWSLAGEPTFPRLLAPRRSFGSDSAHRETMTSQLGGQSGA